DLVRQARVVEGEPRPQRLVPGDHGVERPLERLGVHAAADAEKRRRVVRRARAVEPAQEPQALLRESERNRHGTPCTAESSRTGVSGSAAAAAASSPKPSVNRATNAGSKRSSS